MVRIGTETHRKSKSLNRSRAKEMRHDPVSFEKMMWAELRNRKLGGFKFKRQVLIGSYIADFVCLDRKLIVEMDGPFHAERRGYDAARDRYLESQGYKVLRFTNDETGWDVAMTLNIIQHELNHRPSLSPTGGEGRGEGAS
jgi:5-methyltetrahydrofolate--homocysteine methyltransferase